MIFEYCSQEIEGGCAEGPFAITGGHNLGPDIKIQAAMHAAIVKWIDPVRPMHFDGFKFY
jgi:hypothetical protein